MKRLYLIGGPMGVGKTTICKELENTLDKAVYLDGDWCWNYQINNQETRDIAITNITTILNNYLRSESYNNIIFGWVMPKEDIIKMILDKLSLDDVKVIKISLLCSKEELVKRIEKDIEQGIRDTDVIERSLAYLPLYNRFDTIKIDTTKQTINEIVNNIINSN